MAWIFRVLLAAFFALLLSAPLVAADEQADVAIITGRVTSDLHGLPIPYTEVVLIDPDAPEDEIVAATTDALGLYTVTQAISNTWKIKFVPTQVDPYFYMPHIPEYYDDVYTLEEATLITAEVGTVTSNINTSLPTPGQIRGRVTSEATGQPIAKVGVYDVPPGGGTFTDSRGYYTLTTYITGTHRLLFDPPDKSGYAIEYYNNQTSLSEAEPITVVDWRDVRGIDVALTPGGIIKGAMTSTWRGQYIEYPTVEAYNENGDLIRSGSRYNDEPFESNVPDPPGYYTIYNLPPGDYKLKFMANLHAPVTTDEFVHVETGETVSAINAQLRLSITVASIATSPAISETIFLALAHDPSPLLTIDDGKSWQLLSSSRWIQNSALFAYPDRFPSHYMSVEVAPRGLPGEGTRLLTVIGDAAGDYSIHKGFYRSGDYGLSWAGSDVDVPTPPENCGWITQSRLVASPAIPSDLYIIYSCGYNYLMARLLVSNNAGVTWHDVTILEGRTLELTTDSKVYPSPAQDKRVYLYIPGNGWRVSNDGGFQWQLLDFPVESLALDAVNANYLYGWSPREGGPFTRFGKRSTDGGNEWVDWAQQPCPNTFGEVPPQLVAHPTESQLLFLRCDNLLTEGIYRSDNGGDSWQKLEEEKGQLLVADLGSPRRLLWARDDGLFASTDNGESWQALIEDYRIFTRPLYLPNVSVNNP